MLKMLLTNKEIPKLYYVLIVITVGIILTDLKDIKMILP